MASELREYTARPPQPPEEDPRYRAARQKAEARQGYYTHLIVYAVVNTALFAINALTRGDDGSWWFVWPLLGWGVALLLHAATMAFGVFSPEWKEREARRIFERERKRSG
jgi:hypothetical protein